MLSISCLSLPVKAEEPDAVPLIKDEPAPFEGILMPIERAARLYERIQICEEELRLEQKSCENKMDIETKLRLAQEKVLTDALEKARKDAERSWYEDPVLMVGTGAGVGAVVATAATIGFIWLAAQVRIEVPQ